MMNRQTLSRACHRFRLLVLALLSVMLLAGCGSAVSPQGNTAQPMSHASPTPHSPMPTTLRIIRLAPHEAQVAPFSPQTENAAKVQHLFATLRALPPFVLRPFCPNDSGGLYFLTFWNHDAIVAEVSIPAGGCPRVSISNPYGCHAPTATTMDQIAETLVVPPAAVGRMGEFYDTAAPGDPIAPEDPGVSLLPATPCGA